MAAEVTYKLRADVNNGVLVKLTEFLKLPEVIEAGITQGCQEVHHTCSIAHGSQCQFKVITSQNGDHTTSAPYDHKTINN